MNHGDTTGFIGKEGLRARDRGLIALASRIYRVSIAYLARIHRASIARSYLHASIAVHSGQDRL